MNESRSLTEAGEPAASQQDSASADAQPRSTLTTILFVLAGLLAGGASMAVANRTNDHYQVPPELQNFSQEDPVGLAKLVAAEQQAAGQNLMLTATLIGMLVGGAVGVAGGVSTRSVARSIAGLALGLLLGAGLGYVSARIAPVGIGERMDGWMPATATHESKQTWQMARMIAVHGTIWGAIGLAAAVAATLPTGNVRIMLRSGIGGIAAGVLAMMLYHVLLANAFGLSRFDLLLPDRTGPIAAWTLLPAALVALAIGLLSVPEVPSSTE